MLPGLDGIGEEERLNELELFSLKRRRLKSYLIEVIKIVRGIDKVNSHRLSPRGGRGHMFKVRGGKFKRDVRGRFFTQRVVGAWNRLPQEVVEAGTLATCKSGYMNTEGIEKYGLSKGRRFFLQLS